MTITSTKEFLEQYEYDVETNFSVNDIPARWAETKIKPANRFWDDEDYSIEIFSSNVGSRTGSALAISSDSELLAASRGNLISIYHVQSKEQRSHFRGPIEDCQKLLFVPLVSGSGYQLLSQHSHEGGAEGDIVFWTLNERGERITTGTSPPIQIEQLTAQSLEATILSVVESHNVDPMWAPLKILRQDYTAALEKLRSSLILRDLPTLSGKFASFGSKPFSPDGNTLLYIQHAESTQCGMRPVSELPQIIIYDIATHKPKHVLSGHEDAIMWLSFSPNGLIIASASWDSTFRLWNVETGECVRIIGPIGGQCWSGTWAPDSKHVLLSGMREGRPHVAVYSVDTGVEVRKFKHERLRDWVRSVDWSPSGDVIITCRSDVWVWRPLDQRIISSFSLKDGDGKARVFLGESTAKWEDEGRLLTVHTGYGTVEVWDKMENIKWRLQRWNKAGIKAHPQGLVWVKGLKTLVRLGDDGFLRFYEL